MQSSVLIGKIKYCTLVINKTHARYFKLIASYRQASKFKSTQRIGHGAFYTYTRSIVNGYRGILKWGTIGHGNGTTHQGFILAKTDRKVYNRKEKRKNEGQ
ncbi:hypothetical protein D3C87_736610 [compost metagenome]